MEFGAEFTNNNAAQSSSLMPTRHKSVWFFHFLFKTLAIVAYLLGGWFFNTFISLFIAILTFVSADFWWVKNVSGRILVGLRWWNIVDDTGNSQWHFETKAGSANNNNNNNDASAAAQRMVESNLFWTSLVVYQVIWVLYLLLNLFTFRLNWFVVTLIANIMSGSNLYGYLRCRFGRDGLLSGSTMLSLLGPQMFRSAFTSVTSTLIRSKNAAASAAAGGGQPTFATQTMSM